MLSVAMALFCSFFGKPGTTDALVNAGIRAFRGGPSRRGCKVLATTFSHSIDQLAAANWIVESLAKVRIAVLPEDQGLEHEFAPLSKKLRSLLKKTGKQNSPSGVKQAAEKMPVRGETIPQRLLKPHSVCSLYGRPEGRTLQKYEFFRSLFSPH
jgi:hypothetical protein